MMSTRASASELQIPPELQRSTPRDVVLSAGGKALGTFAVAMLAGAIGLGVWLSTQARRDAEFRKQMQTGSVAASGEVTSLDRTRGKDAHWVVTYRYEAAGSRYVGHASVSLRSGSRFPVGSAVDIGYLASDARVSWIRGHEPRGTPSWVPLVVPLALLLPPFLIVFRIRCQRRLLEEGRPAIARVTAIQRVRHQHSQGYRVSIEFHDMSGALRTGRFEKMQRPPAVGADVVILYDPEERKRMARYPMSLVRVRAPL